MENSVSSSMFLIFIQTNMFCWCEWSTSLFKGHYLILKVKILTRDNTCTIDHFHFSKETTTTEAIKPAMTVCLFKKL